MTIIELDAAIKVAKLFQRTIDEAKATNRRLDTSSESIGSEYDMREIKWGFSRDEVKRTEGMNWVHEDDDYLIYDTTANNLACYLIFHFAGDKIAAAYYVFNEYFSNDQEFVIQGKALKAILTEKYGAPVYDQTIWKTENIELNTMNYGEQLRYGRLTLFSGWENNSSSIDLVITAAEAMQVMIGLVYTSKSLYKEASSSRWQKFLNEF